MVGTPPRVSRQPSLPRARTGRLSRLAAHSPPPPAGGDLAMQYVDAARTHALLDYPGLVEALRELFRRGVDKLERMGLSQPLPKGEGNFWLILPAWRFGR